MDRKIEAFFSKVSGEKIAVIGAGISNTPVIELLHSKGAQVEVRDRQNASKMPDRCALFNSLGIHYVFGTDYLKNLHADRILRSPGIRFDLPEFQAAEEEGALLTSEMEIFFELCPCKIIAVTGSDGKSTTTTMIEQLLTAQGFKCHLGGNLGRPLLPDIEAIEPGDMAVVELSSFQLQTMKKSASVSVVTNISPNHLDYHKDYAEYIAAKENVFSHQAKDGILVLNADNEITRSFAGRANGVVRLFTKQGGIRDGAFYHDGAVYLVKGGREEKLLSRKDILLPGDYNVENLMAAYLAVSDYVTPQTLLEVSKTFGGIPHRLEFIRELAGVSYYNNSIASSPSRVQAVFSTFEEKLIIIAGGSDKKIPFDDFGVEINKHVKLLLLSGATTPKIYNAVINASNYNPQNIRIALCSSIFEAIDIARREATPGDTVVLNPACPSFDKFKNFEERGDRFRDAVNALKQE